MSSEFFNCFFRGFPLFLCRKINENLFSRFSFCLIFSNWNVLISYFLQVVECKGGWKGKILNDSSFIFGPFLVGTLWIFHFTFGSFKRFFFVNLLMDSLFAFLLSYLYQKLNLFKLVNFKPKHIFFSFISFCLTIYGYQALTNKDK